MYIIIYLNIQMWVIPICYSEYVNYCFAKQGLTDQIRLEPWTNYRMSGFGNVRRW